MISSLHRPTLAKVDLSAISENIEQVVSHIPKKVKTFAVVKANAYGHGAVAVAKQVSEQVDGFCVSNLDEALELRQAGLEQPILILGVVLPDGVPLAIQENISLTVASLEWLALAQKQGLDLTGLTCHIKVDSGMGRIGVRSLEDADNLIAGLNHLVPMLKVFLPILQRLMRRTIVNSSANWPSSQIWWKIWLTVLVWYTQATQRQVSGMPKPSLMRYVWVLSSMVSILVVVL